MLGLSLTAIVWVATSEALAQAPDASPPMPTFLITGFIDQLITYSNNTSSFDTDLHRKDYLFYGRNRGRFDIVGEYGKAKAVLGLELDFLYGQTGSGNTNVASGSGRIHGRRGACGGQRRRRHQASSSTPRVTPAPIRITWRSASRLPPVGPASENGGYVLLAPTPRGPHTPSASSRPVHADYAPRSSVGHSPSDGPACLRGHVSSGRAACPSALLGVRRAPRRGRRGLAECHCPALTWIVELHRLRIETLRIEPAAEPRQHAVVLLVGGVGNHRDDVLITWRTPAVLGRTGALTSEAAREAACPSGAARSPRG